MVIGLFRDRESAERAIAAVTARGYEPKDINVVIDDDVRQRFVDSHAGKEPILEGHATEKLDLGGPAGGTLGTLFTAVTAVGTFMLVPGLVLVGPIAQALAAAGAAAVTGGLIGALHDWGIPNDRVERYEAAIKRGHILLGVRPRNEDDAELFEREWKALGAERLET
jgi:hypothetical protein